MSDVYVETDADRSIQQEMDGAVVEVPAEEEPAKEESDSVSPSDIEGMSGGNMDDYVSWDTLSELERDDEFERVLRRSDPGFSEAELREGWRGGEYDRNREFGNAMLRATTGSAAALRVLEAVGIADHPDLVKWIVSAGRAMAAKSGDPASITNKRETTMEDEDAFEDAITDIRAKGREAHQRGDYARANRFAAREREMYAKRDGDGPVVGRDGRTA